MVGAAQPGNRNLGHHPLPFRSGAEEEGSEASGIEDQRMTRKAVVARQCSNGTDCVAYPALGQPSKLSWGNPETRCFACEERRVASELKAAAKGRTAKRQREVRLPLLEGQERHPPTMCAKRSCVRPATEWDGIAYFCALYAEAQRARVIQERSRYLVTSSEEKWRSA